MPHTNPALHSQLSLHRPQLFSYVTYKPSTAFPTQQPSKPSCVQRCHTLTQHCIHNSAFTAQLCSALSHTKSSTAFIALPSQPSSVQLAKSHTKPSTAFIALPSQHSSVQLAKAHTTPSTAFITLPSQPSSFQLAKSHTNPSLHS